MKCSHCNTTIESDSAFCANCGRKVSTQSAGSITVGKASDNDIVIKNSYVSSHHARFLISGGTIELEDLGSANGTYVNGSKVQRRKVSQSDTIQFSRRETFDWNQLTPFLSGEPKPEPKESKVKVLDGDYSKGKDSISIGRAEDNDIVIDNIKVSRHHAKLQRVNNTWHIEDLKSSNGTFFNGKRISKTSVSPSDVVTIGGIPLNLHNLFEEKEEKVEISGDVELGCKDLSFIVGNNKVIIDDISLTFYPGEFIGLIGPSGAGKTSLMMMLNGMVRPSKGDVFINGQSLFANFSSFKGQLGYVPQDDIIHRELKVEESLRYTAKLRFDASYSSKEINSQVDNVIDTLDLSEARKTLIGTAEKKGISGGQRKRVNLGQELLTEPSVLFLDEPTSGLDPKTDMDVMQLLKGIANKGKLVVLTTHSITRENFNTLSHLVVLTKGGKLAYFGPADEAVDYFDVKEPYEIFDTLNAQEPDYWKKKYRSSEYFPTFVTDRESKGLGKETHRAAKAKKDDVGGVGQFFTLTSRYLKVKLRDKVSTSILLLQAPIIAFLIALVFSGQGAEQKGLFILVIASIWLGCSNAAREIVSEQSIYKRERMVNLGIPSYIFSKIFVLAFLCVIQTAIMVGIVHASLSLQIPLIELFILLLSTSIASLMIGLFLSSLVNTNEAAMGLVPIVLIPQVILGGLITILSEMSTFIKILAGLTISRWSFEAGMVGEFRDMPPDPQTGLTLLDQFGFDKGNLPVDYAVIFAFFILFFMFIAMKLKSKDI